MLRKTVSHDGQGAPNIILPAHGVTYFAKQPWARSQRFLQAHKNQSMTGSRITVKPQFMPTAVVNDIQPKQIGPHLQNHVSFLTSSGIGSLLCGVDSSINELSYYTDVQREV